MKNTVHKYIVCAGSNTHNAKNQIERAFFIIKDYFENAVISEIINTIPEEIELNCKFSNAIIIFETRQDTIQTRMLLKRIEYDLGRIKNSTVIHIALDIIKIDDNIVHISYYQRKFINKLINNF